MQQKQTKTITQTKKIQTATLIKQEGITEVIRKTLITQKQKDKKLQKKNGINKMFFPFFFKKCKGK